MIRRIVNGTGTRIKKGWRKVALACGVAGLVGLGFCLGRGSAQTVPGKAPAQSPVTPVGVQVGPIVKPGELVPTAPVVPENGSDYSRRVVAYVYHNIPITREELGEYLIARYGVEKVEALVNRKIIDMACSARGIHITDAEVNSALAQDLRELGITSEKDFEAKILRPRNATLFQWKEDVLRPKLALTQYCQGRVKVTEEDIQQAFENRYGPKVKCRMILLPLDQGRHKLQIWEQVRKSPEEFDKQARTQAVPALAARGGEVPPICRHCGDKRIEEEAFSLSAGEVSKVIETPDGYIILKCVARIPAENKTLTKEVRAALEKELMDRKILEEIPKVLKELKAKAEPQYFFKKTQTAEELYRDAAKLSGVQVRATPPGTVAPGRK